ncbi:hypothetical protein EV383_4202 [Pseudonocardia sediminis]|uniref:Alpha amylase inhibitor n=1 Tax=Pseudonocardia sediminis TaxID=1397368 RepID=A0A4Q7UYW5_PSEST|nr:hypothetical protein [Pseudonocardia sediminis]RZT87292.1 hypothetical protein EV383_4202 [Pseudonocardia sediminis]
MKNLFKRVAVTVAAAGILTSGMAVVAASEAMAATPPCGLDYQVGELPGGPLKIVYYTIRNCNNSTVKRKLDIAGTTDGECVTVGPGKTVSKERVITGWASVRGMKSC